MDLRSRWSETHVFKSEWPVPHGLKKCAFRLSQMISFAKIKSPHVFGASSFSCVSPQRNTYKSVWRPPHGFAKCVFGLSQMASFKNVCFSWRFGFPTNFVRFGWATPATRAKKTFTRHSVSAFRFCRTTPASGYSRTPLLESARLNLIVLTNLSFFCEVYVFGCSLQRCTRALPLHDSTKALGQTEDMASVEDVKNISFPIFPRLQTVIASCRLWRRYSNIIILLIFILHY